ncbi:hypothetical protein QBC46DRAFT_384047 [Diplogelasinospora grovesii]|uniref:Peptidase M20 dimerisation domain-containing protein n=1 Tax=Diplogelasinospora grovesii TaxID=303347 RepID=A0AAN6NA01_9PEZI|nr:hypothetical protein QBC46DRAFT_384047 [Diplogelasinospora grovesii]
MHITRHLLWGGLLCMPAVAFYTHPSFYPQQQQQPIGDIESKKKAPPASSYRDDLLSLHRSLVEIPSISGSEQDVGIFLKGYLTERGYTVELQYLPPSEKKNTGDEQQFNVLAWPSTNKNNGGPKVLVTSHIDVVPPYIPYHVSEQGSSSNLGSDTQISGRGSVDAKASVAAQIIAVEELLRQDDVSGEDVMLLFVVSEETDGGGMKHFSSVYNNNNNSPPTSHKDGGLLLEIKAAIFGEPTENKLACGHKGHAGGTVLAHGKAGHSGYPWLGRSATEILMRAMVDLLDADLGSSERFGNTTVNVGVIQGGVAANVIPKEASARLAIRVAVGNQTDGADIVRQKVQKLLEGKEGLELTNWMNGYGPVECYCEVEGFETMIANYGTDVPNLEGGHRSYLYGPGSILVAHGDDEALRVKDLEEAVEGYKKLILHALEA